MSEPEGLSEAVAALYAFYNHYWNVAGSVEPSAVLIEQGIAELIPLADSHALSDLAAKVEPYAERIVAYLGDQGRSCRELGMCKYDPCCGDFGV